MASAAQPGAAQPGLPTTGEHELEEMADKKASLPIEEDVMQLARLGEIGAIQKLFDSGRFDATYKDEQGITPLHWAAINNHYALCHFLIQAGAPINAKGGDAVATPVLWAAKRCNYYVVNLLLDHGADPLLTDDQGFNLLHSATLDGNVYQLVLLLHQDIPVDIPDPQSHTPLMWAAYKGYSSCVHLFLRWGANVYATDDQGFTALHWALVKGSQGSIQKLLEYGADRFAKNNDGKTPAVTAEEMNTVRQWHRALSEAGFDRNGNPKAFPIPGVKDTRWFLSRFIFFLPFVIVFQALFLVSHYPAFVGMPAALIIAYVLQLGAHKLLQWGPSNMRNLEVVDSPKDVTCAVLSDDLCKIYYKDPFTIVLAIWAALQSTWVTMLLCVQLLQIARNLTTYESMRGHLDSHTPADALTSFVTTGDTSQDVSGSAGHAPTNGFGSGQDIGDIPRIKSPRGSVWQQWKQLLGLDTFLTIALQGSRAGQTPFARPPPKNPFSRGIITNCKDFWCDGSPVFGRKEGGFAKLGGERVDYTRLYEVPTMRYQSGGAGEGGRYESVAAEEEES
ncbi:hypothetical protein IAQ61_002226 [Plenodomus lingam]|uniref:uncharacterized protein n=1 Tax=Leptosphaeria maculans TaxID=5022 RepID=UPI00332007AC|nr:hypothetical protein IAQ61_002226 [Plenodomus lingam]